MISLVKKMLFVVKKWKNEKFFREKSGNHNLFENSRTSQKMMLQDLFFMNWFSLNNKQIDLMFCILNDRHIFARVAREREKKKHFGFQN